MCLAPIPVLQGLSKPYQESVNHVSQLVSLVWMLAPAPLAQGLSIMSPINVVIIVRLVHLPMPSTMCVQLVTPPVKHVLYLQQIVHLAMEIKCIIKDLV